VRLKRVKESIFESDEKLFALPDILDEENGPYADLLDHLTRCRVKMLNDLFTFERQLTVDEVEDEIREDQNTHFIEGKAVHTSRSSARSWITCPTGSTPTRSIRPRRPRRKRKRTNLPALDAEEEEKLKNDESLKWDEDGDDEEEEEGEKAEAKGDSEESAEEEAEKAKKEVARQALRAAHPIHAKFPAPCW